MFIRELQSCESELLRQAFWIYARSFPPEERDPEATLIDLIRRREAGFAPGEATFHFLGAIEADQVAGMGIISFYPPARMGYLPYLAVHPERRNAGLGARLYARLLACIASDGETAGGEGARGVTFEVEQPDLAANPADRELRRRRIGFYQRLGASIVEPLSALLTPPLGPGLPEVPYTILFHSLGPLGAEVTGSPRLTRTEIEAVVRTVLEHGYRLPPDSEYIRRALASANG